MVMENGFSSPRATDSFPAGLRVLVVDDDPTWLKILERMLKKCNYDVTTSGLAREALRLLRERKDGYDIVISDVNMPDMDGFKLLEHVGLEMDLPVIMMSVDGETSRVMKGVQHGACDYLLKPIRMKELKNIWQHVFRKRMIEVRDIESYDSIDDFHLFRNAADLADDGHFGDQFFLKKRKDIDNKNGDNESSSNKKQRVVWSVDLHQKFVKAVNHIGFDKVGPKKILDLMNVPWLTRENVASHLQKYRLYLSRLQKENGIKNQSSKDAGEGFGNIRCVQVPTEDAKMPNKNCSKGCMNLPPLTVPVKPFNTVSHKATTSSPNMAHSVGSLKPEINYTPFDCPLASQFAWEFESKPQHPVEEEVLHDRFNNQPAVGIPHQQIQTVCFEQQPFLVGQATGSALNNPGLNLDMYSLPADMNQSTSIGFDSHLLGSEPVIGSWMDDLAFYPFQGDQFATTSVGYDNMEYHLPNLLNEDSPVCFYGAPRYEFEHLSDSIEYGVVDQGLPIS